MGSKATENRATESRIDASRATDRRANVSKKLWPILVSTSKPDAGDLATKFRATETSVAIASRTSASKRQLAASLSSNICATTTYVQPSTKLVKNSLCREFRSPTIKYKSRIKSPNLLSHGSNQTTPNVSFEKLIITAEVHNSEENEQIFIDNINKRTVNYNCTMGKTDLNCDIHKEQDEDVIQARDFF